MNGACIGERVVFTGVFPPDLSGICLKRYLWRVRQHRYTKKTGLPNRSLKGPLLIISDWLFVIGRPVTINQ